MDSDHEANNLNFSVIYLIIGLILIFIVEYWLKHS